MGRPSKTAASRQAVQTYLRQLGVGGTFTQHDLRALDPDAVQIDRRMRELRQMLPEPWRIASSQSDRTLPMGVYRIDFIGGDTLPKRLSARVRREVFEADDNRCRVCGIGVNEEYGDFPDEVARLQIGHWVPIDQGGSRTARGNLRTECHRCNGGIRNRTGPVGSEQSVKSRVRALSRRDRADLLRWLQQQRRDVPDNERLFYEIRQLPFSSQEEVQAELVGLVGNG